MKNIIELIGREDELFSSDISRLEDLISREVAQSRFLVIGAAGTIGQAVTRERQTQSGITSCGRYL